MAKNEAKIKFSAETGEFNDAIKKSNDELSSLRSEMKLNATQMQTTGRSIEGLEKKHKILTAELEASQNKTEALNQKLNKAVEIFGENSTEVMKLKTQLINAQVAEEKIKQAINNCNNELQEQKDAMQEAESATSQLTDKISDQEKELARLKKEYVEASLKYGDTSTEAKQLERSISDLSGELKQSKTQFSQVSKKADDLDQSLDNAGDGADDAGEGFTVMKGVVADLASNAIQAAIGKISEFCGWLAELPAETMELRQDLSTLTTSFDDVGLSTATATDTWKDLYAIFGEDDRAVETANNIAKIADNQEELNTWIDITTGAWGKHQDSLPVEGLAEAAMETAKTGTVTGTLCDALNWASKEGETFGVKLKKNIEFTKLSSKELSKLTPKQKAEYEAKKKQYEETEKYNQSLKEAKTAEERFQFALDKCTTEQERAELITSTLNSLYSESADVYRETQGSQMEAKDATAENMLAQANLATAIEPVTTAFTELKTELMQGIQPAVEKVSEVMVGALGWMKEHPVAMKAIAAAVGVVALGLTALTAVVIGYTVAQWAMNSAILANPITWIIMGIVAAIAAVAAIIVVVVSYWDEIVLAVQNACASVMAALQSAWTWISGIFTGIATWVNTNVIQPVVNFFVGLWTKLQEIWNTICNVVQVAFMFIGSIISAAVDIITLPFMFIWENCKQYVFTAWEWIKEKVSAGINAIRTVVTTVMNAIKSVFSKVWNAIKNTISTVVNAIKNTVSKVWNSIKSVTSSVFNSVKTVASNVWNGIKNAISTVINGIKTKVSSVFNSVKSTVSSVFNGIKSTATSVWNGIKNAITKPIQSAKEKVKTIVDSIKNLFNNMKLKFPKIKMPKFSIKGKFSLDPPSVPKLSIKWNAQGGILTRPTIFGAMGSTLLGGGEAGPEAILPIDKLEGYVSNAVEKTMQKSNMYALVNAIEDLADRAIQLNVNGRQLATATAGDADSVNGLRSSLINRGLVL